MPPVDELLRALRDSEEEGCDTFLHIWGQVVMSYPWIKLELRV